MRCSDDGPDDHSLEEHPVENHGEQRPRYLFPVDGEHSSTVLGLVCDLVADAGAELYIAAPVVLPEQTPLDTLEPRQEGHRRTAEFVLKANQECHGTPVIDSVVKAGRDRGAILQDIVEEYSISTLVTEAHPHSGIRTLLGFDTVDEIGLSDESDRIVVSRIKPFEDVDSVLVPIARGPHSGMAIDTGLAIARQNDASLELFHVYDSDDDDARIMGEEVIEIGMERAGTYEHVDRTLRDSSDIAGAIIEEAGSFDVTVLGAPREGRLQQFVIGTIPDEVSARTDRTTLVTHRGGTEESWLDRWI